jgi:hypothetical protein
MKKHMKKLRADIKKQKEEERLKAAKQGRRLR